MKHLSDCTSARHQVLREAGRECACACHRKAATSVSHVLMTLPEGGYEKHALDPKVEQPGIEGWVALCGRTIFRSRAMMAHSLLPARICPACAEAAMR